MTASTTAVSRVLDAFQANAFEPELFHDDATSWHNFDEKVIPVRESFDAVAEICKLVPDFQFADRVHHAASDGVSVAQYNISGTMPDGSALRAVACLFVHTRDGKVSRIEEYADTAQLAPLFVALTPGD